MFTKTVAAMIAASTIALASVASAADLSVFPNAGGQFDLGCQDAKAFRGEAFDNNVDSFTMSFETSEGLVLGQLPVDVTTGIARLPVTVPPLSGDVRVVCFSVDRSGNRSPRSVDSFLVDRTAPEPPTALAP